MRTQHKQTIKRNSYNTITAYRKPLVGDGSCLNELVEKYPRITATVLGLIITAGYIFAGIVEAA